MEPVVGHRIKAGVLTEGEEDRRGQEHPAQCVAGPAPGQHETQHADNAGVPHRRRATAGVDALVGETGQRRRPRRPAPAPGRPGPRRIAGDASQERPVTCPAGAARGPHLPSPGSRYARTVPETLPLNPPGQTSPAPGTLDGREPRTGTSLRLAATDITRQRRTLAGQRPARACGRCAQRFRPGTPPTWDDVSPGLPRTMQLWHPTRKSHQGATPMTWGAVGEIIGQARGTHRRWPAKTVFPVRLLSSMICWITTRVSALGSALSATDHRF